MLVMVVEVKMLLPPLLLLLLLEGLQLGGVKAGAVCRHLS